ncbi:hypothetical protein LguiB_022512 [Lonicera macranthoides]
MSDPYGKVKGGRLTFKGGDLATRTKSIDKKHKKKKKKKNKLNKSSDEIAVEEILSGEAAEAVAAEEGSSAAAAAAAAGEGEGEGGGGDIYTIDAAKRRKYDELFPVEARKFGYDPKAKVKSVEEALDDRVKKKADRYCK